MKITFTSHSLDDTLRLGRCIGQNLGGGEVVELSSDLGGGKTALTKGIAAGMGSTDTVQSPTFTISRIYRCRDDRELHHFDFYRLQDAGIMAAELAESLNDDQVVVVIEWSGIVEAILPASRIQVVITATGETDRQFVIEVPHGLTRLQAALTQLKEDAA